MVSMFVRKMQIFVRIVPMFVRKMPIFVRIVPMFLRIILVQTIYWYTDTYFPTMDVLFLTDTDTSYLARVSSAILMFLHFYFDINTNTRCLLRVFVSHFLSG